MDELQGVVLELKTSLDALEAHLQSNPDDQEALQLHAELSEALASSEAAVAAYTADDNTNPEGPLDPAAQAEEANGSGSSQQQLALQQAAAAADLVQQHEAATDPSDGYQAQNDTNHHHQQQQQQKRKAGPGDPSAAQQPAKQRRKALTMHPANLYAAGEPDFAALAAAHPPLAQHLIYPGAAAAAAAGAGSSSGRGVRPVLDFTSWEATKELTAALLKVDFGVVWDLPQGQLVPPVPNRANYIHWIADLLQLSAPQGVTGPVTGLDIGCGANLIYCLLGAAVYGWRMVGVDVSDTALTAAHALVQANPQLEGLLEVRQSACEEGSDLTQVGHQPGQQQQQQQQGREEHGMGPVAGALVGSDERFHFCMCNPPFFESLAEANRNPNTACGGTATEMVTPGGELSFVRAMIADSLVLRGRVHWYSSMCGKKNTLKILRQELHNAGVTALRTTELVQGKTSRWAVAWSFSVPASTANLPLPRAQRPQQQQQQQQQQSPTQPHQQQQQPVTQPQRQKQHPQQQQQQQQQVSFTVEASVSEGRRVLQALAALLASLCGATALKVDTSKWTIQCQLPTTQQQQGGAAVSAADGEMLAVEVGVFQQRKVLQVVAKVVGGSSSSSSSSSSAVASLALLQAAFMKVRQDMELMWVVSDAAV